MGHRKLNEDLGPSRTESGLPSPVAKNVATIAALEAEALRARSRGERFAEFITHVTGSTPFMLVHGIWFSMWVLINVRVLSWIEPFDPFPFSFLTLIVSLEAIFLSIFVLISQNRSNRQADRRALLTLQIDLLAEQESTKILSLLERIADHMQVPPESSEPDELAQPTDVQQVDSALRRELPSDSK